MKNLKNLLENIIPVTTVSLGMTLIGIGIYNLEKKNTEKGIFHIGFGVAINALGVCGYFGREDEKKANKNNYQTKPEDYK